MTKENSLKWNGNNRMFGPFSTIKRDTDQADMTWTVKLCTPCNKRITSIAFFQGQGSLVNFVPTWGSLLLFELLQNLCLLINFSIAYIFFQHLHGKQKISHISENVYEEKKKEIWRSRKTNTPKRQKMHKYSNTQMLQKRSFKKAVGAIRVFQSVWLDDHIFVRSWKSI